MSQNATSLETTDKAALDKVKVQVQLANSAAETAVSQKNVAQLTYQNTLLQLALKYSLNNSDMINEDGTIVRNAVDPATGQPVLPAPAADSEVTTA